MMRQFLSCDWGTSSFRLRVVNADTLDVLAETVNSQGISASFDWWQRTGREEDSRLAFYQSFILAQLKKLEEQLKYSLANTPLIISGMASSRIGMIELPYKKLPFYTDGRDLEVKTMAETDDFKHAMVLVSGARTENDVMRGEETQLVGCTTAGDEGEQVFIFPGTHSKHVRVEKGKVIDITTYMTGEFFELLTQKSILSGDIEVSDDPLEGVFLKRFEKGVRDSLGQNILHSSFFVRINHLLGKSGKKENYFYLSGLLIGTELKELAGIARPLVLVSNRRLQILYMAAFRVFGMEKIESQFSDQVIIKGHYKIYNQHLAGLNS